MFVSWRPLEGKSAPDYIEYPGCEKRYKLVKHSWTKPAQAIIRNKQLQHKLLFETLEIVSYLYAIFTWSSNVLESFFFSSALYIIIFYIHFPFQWYMVQCCSSICSEYIANIMNSPPLPSGREKLILSKREKKLGA